MTHLENKLKWCLKKGEEKEHHGLKKTTPSKKNTEKHIEKALHNLEAAEHNKERFQDWAVSAAYYSMYHAFLAVLAKFGYESRNHECTFVFIEHLISKNKIQLATDDIEAARQFQAAGGDVKTLREFMQYGTETELEREKLDTLVKTARETVEKVRLALENLEEGEGRQTHAG